MDRHSHKMRKSLSWLERARDGTPVVEGDQATFVWQGSRSPRWIGDLNDWDPERAPLLAEAEPGVWIHSVRLPRDAYVEYGYVLDGERVPDPLNPRTVIGGPGAANNYFYMPDGGPSPLAERRRGVPHGRIARHTLPTDEMLVGRHRQVALYRPPVDEPCPLLLVFDGQDYMRRGRLIDIVDNLIAERRMRPVAMALLNHGGAARMVEYACSETTVMYVLKHVLPLARRELSLLDPDASPGPYGVCGASMSGLMALYTALRVPHVFGYVLSQSGAFSFDGYDTVVFDLIRAGAARPLRVWMDAGRFEWLRQANQKLQPVLAEHGCDVVYREYNGAHNYTAWRDDISHGLEWLFKAE